MEFDIILFVVLISMQTKSYHNFKQFTILFVGVMNIMRKKELKNVWI
jgi:hypothetical protein